MLVSCLASGLASGNMRVCSLVEMAVIKSIWKRELLGSMQCDSKSKGLDGMDEDGKDESDASGST